jgi:predicted nucleic acid-binding protein
LPGVQLTDESPWRRVFDVWPRPLPSLADASIVAVAMANRYEAVATFDRKLANRLESFGLAAYF